MARFSGDHASAPGLWDRLGLRGCSSPTAPPSRTLRLTPWRARRPRGGSSTSRAGPSPRRRSSSAGSGTTEGGPGRRGSLGARKGGEGNLWQGLDRQSLEASPLSEGTRRAQKCNSAPPACSDSPLAALDPSRPDRRPAGSRARGSPRPRSRSSAGPSRSSAGTTAGLMPREPP